MRNKINIIVTSGGTEEYIDDVRVLTNISTGKLGNMIAEKLASLSIIRVHYVCSRTAVRPQFPTSNFKIYEVRTAQDAFDTIASIMREEEINAVIHCMAVSDFTFKRDVAVKLKSNDEQGFIDYLRGSIKRNPKIISYIKEWNPEAILVGFKFEVGVTLEHLTELAKASIERNKCDLVIANDKEEMKAKQNHIGHFIYSEEAKAQYDVEDGLIPSKKMIAAELMSFIMEVFDLDFD